MIIELLLQNASSSSQALKIDSKGDLTLGSPDFIDKAQKLINAGEYSKSKVAKYLTENINDLYTEVKDHYANHGKLSVLQQQIDSIFKGTSYAKPDLMSHIYSDWMGGLSEQQKSSPLLSSIFLPGTHDSAACKIDWSHSMIHNSKVDPKLYYGTKPLEYMPGVNNIVENWTITQNESIAEQLKHGIRLFDLRIAYDDVDQKFYITHTFTVGALEETLREFSKFLANHPSEVAVINIKPDYIHRETVKGHEKELSQLIEKHLGSMLISPAAKNITLNQAFTTHKNAIVAYQGNHVGSMSDNIWSANHSQEIWQNKSTVDGELKALDDTFSSSSKSFGHDIDYASFTVTPQLDTITHNKSLYSVSQILNDHLGEFLDCHPDISHQVNGFIVDFPSYDTIEAMIGINTKHGVFHK